MATAASMIKKLFSIRNRFGKNHAAQKLELLGALGSKKITGKKDLLAYHDSLLFIAAYPDNKKVYEQAGRSLEQLASYIRSHTNSRDRLYNSGLGQTQLCTSFGFELVKWMWKNYPGNIRLSSFDAEDEKIQGILSVMMPRVESEILQDANENWRSWLKRSMTGKEDMLDHLLAIFDQSCMRPAARDECWNALGLNVEIDLPVLPRLPASLTVPFYHRSLTKKLLKKNVKPVPATLDQRAAAQIIACARMILVQHFREIDPISFTDTPYVSYYHLPRGLSIALMGMAPARRSPVDCYIGYMVFKNGLPVAYAGSWILFDSGRIGLNVFPSYRGGESKYIFDQVLHVHHNVYRLGRFTVDPYQLGKENEDGIQSGAFWIYYHAGFRPLRKKQRELAKKEAQKIKTVPGYRSPASTLKILCDSRMELVLKKNAVRFDATDLSRVFSAILKTQYNNNRKTATDHAFIRLAKLLQVKNYHEKELQFILENWCVLLFSNGEPPPLSNHTKKGLKKLFEQKAAGREEDYITGLQRAGELRQLMEKIVTAFSVGES